ncbi:unnamed protein product [Discula destructiva]
MALLASHLEQISISCQGIDSLPFPPPKIFTNALLSNHDITSLIRDTETHERALFSVPPPAPLASLQQPPGDEETAPTRSSRRQTVFNVSAGEVTTGPPTSRGGGGGTNLHHNPRRNTAVAAVLGGEMHSAITRRYRAAEGQTDAIDIEVLLHGAEKLCAVYPLPGADGRVAGIRQRWAGQGNTLAYYEAKVAEQAERLGRLGRKDDRFADDVEEEAEAEGVEEAVLDSLMTEEDLRQEEQEVRELESRKRELQERLRAIDRDLGGLLHM